MSEMSSESEAEEWMSSIVEQTKAQLVSRIEEFRRQGMMKESRNVQRMYDELAFGSCAVASATEPVAARHAADLTPLKRWASESQQSDHTTYLSAGAWPADAAAVRPLLRESVHKSAMLAAPVIEVVGESPEVIRLKERLKAQEGAIREMNRKLDENNAAAATSEAVPTSEAAAASEPSATSEAATTSEAAATSAAAAELVRLRERTAVARLRERLGQQEGAVLRELGAH